MKTIRERDIEAYLVKQARVIGAEVRKVKWIGRAGAPDRLVMSPAHGAMWVELKAPGERPTAAQYREHRRMRDKGLSVWVVDSFQDVDYLLALQ